MKLTRLLAFAAIGTAVGLLLTTKKGKALRSDIADRSGSLLKQLNKFSRSTASDAGDLVHDARKMTSEVI